MASGNLPGAISIDGQLLSEAVEQSRATSGYKTGIFDSFQISTLRIYLNSKLKRQAGARRPVALLLIDNDAISKL